MVASNLSEGIAFQIRATRDKQHITQADLARESGMTPNNLSRLESPDYGKQTISSLKRIADALDVALVVRFVPFSHYIDWLSGTPRLDDGLNANSLAVDCFEQEEQNGTLEWFNHVWMVNKNQIIENRILGSPLSMQVESSAEPLTNLDFPTEYCNCVAGHNFYYSPLKPNDLITGYTLDQFGGILNTVSIKPTGTPVNWGSLCTPDQNPIWMNEKVG